MRRMLVLALFVLHAGLLVHGLRQNFITVDEPGHFAGGLSHWDTGTFCTYRVNPPLVRMLAVLPALLARPARNYENLKDPPG